MTRSKRHPRLFGDERGLALVSVAMLGAFLVLVTVLVSVRTVNQSRATGNDQTWEQALHVAESGVDLALTEFLSDPLFNTGKTIVEVDTREEVLQSAIDIASDPSSPYYASAVIETGEGTSVLIAPTDADVVYGVGFTPSFDAYEAGNGKARVVVSDLGPPLFKPSHAVLAGGPLFIEAKKDDKNVDLTCPAFYPDCDDSGGWIHTNGKIEFKDLDKNQHNIIGCLTAYGESDDVLKDNGDPRTKPEDEEKDFVGPYTNDDDSAYPDCPEISEQDGPPAITTNPNRKVPYIGVPDINPMNLHYMSHFDVCPTGIYWGPAGSNHPDWPGGAATEATVDVPCSGSQILGPVYDDWILGLKNGHKDGDPGYDRWDDRVEFTKHTIDGIFFLWGRSAKVKKSKDEGDRYWTIIGSKGPARDKLTLADRSNDLDCGGKDHLEVWNPKDGKWEDIDKDQFGDVEIEIENDDIFPYGWTGDFENPGEGKGYTVVTAGDIKMKIKGDKELADPGEAWGMFLAHEQVRIESSDLDEGKGAIYGSVIVQDDCDTEDSLHHDKISEFKKGDILFPKGLGATDFLVEDTETGEYRVLSTNEF